MRRIKLSKQKIRNNSGSAIVTVVISMLFVMLLGAALLFASYTAYSVEITQRGDKENFYDASSAMDDIRLGVQTMLSDAVANAYTGALVDYVGTHTSTYDAQTDFNNRIIAELLTKKVDTDGDTVADTYVFTSTDKTVITGYNANALEAYIDTSKRSYSKVTDGNEDDGDGIKGNDFTGIAKNAFSEGVLQSCTLKSICIKYISDKGYESDITTDIVVTMPYFFASSSVTSGINNYAIIADKSIIHNITSPSTKDVSISGSVFAGAGGITVSDNNDSLSFTDGDLICKGKITVNPSTTFTYNATDNELWADDIEVNGAALLDGNVYVRNDLLLNELGASVKLKNTYFGFGDSSSNADNSSSILINGKRCSLDISGLSKLSLAGVSFINTSKSNPHLQNPDNSEYSSDIPMGQSMSVKSDQLAYLVPIKCISNYPSNPYFITGDTVPPPTINYDTVLWGTSEDAKTLLNYIDKDDIGTKGKVMTLYKTVDATAKTKVVYVFMVFKSQTCANAYFKDYFNADPSKIKQYMDLYLETLSDKAANAKINTAGNTFYMAGGTALTLNPASDKVYATGAQLLYNKMNSPYQVFVNTVALSKLGSTPLKFTDSSGNVVAIVANGNYDFDSTSPMSIRLIIASGNVTITNNSTHDGVTGYKGIVISGGNVTANADVTGELLTSSILDSTCTVGTTTYKLSDFVNNSAQIIGNSGLSDDLWDLDSLVSYANWQKH